jgi:hypothetical protein
VLLDLKSSLGKNVITPYQQAGRNYHLLFLRRSEGPFYVRDTAYKLETLINIGEVYTKIDDKRNLVVGNIFFTRASVQCLGTYLLAYSGMFHEQAQNKIPSDVNMELVLKEKGFQVFNQRNRATLIISPAIKDSIRQNLEI